MIFFGETACVEGVGRLSLSGMSRTKITLIGAGSVVFAKRLIGDILQFPALAEAEICLMDIDAQRLKVAERTTEKIREALGVDARVTATLDRTEAVRGADYVICTIQVGGYEPSTVRDFEIPAKYGLRQTIADTLGVGGVFRGLRTIPKLVEIAEDIALVGSPGCLFINYSNPMAMNCWAIDRAVGVPHVGLCHSVQGTSRQLANYVDLPYEEVSFLVAGINHMAFFLRFDYGGRDAYPLLFKALEDPRIRDLDAVRFEMMRRTGYFVTESSEHQSEYVPYFIPHGPEMIERFNIPIDEYRRRCESIIATWKEEERKLLGEAEGTAFTVEPQSHEYGAYIVHARETNEPTVIYGNVPNRDLISNLTPGCCVEVPCLVDGNGIQPVRIGSLPPQLAALCQSNIAVQELTVEAALTGKREAIYHAVMLDPHTAATLSLDQIWSMCDELIEVHQKDGYLGDFKPVLPGTGRSYAGTGDRTLAELKPGGEANLEAAGPLPVVLKVTSPEGTPEPLQFHLELPEEIRRLNGEGPIEVEAGAGESVEVPLSLELRAPISTSIRLGLSSENREVLCRDLTLRPRKCLEADADGRFPFQIEMAGNAAVRGFFSRKGANFVMEGRVLDSDIQPVILGQGGIKKGSGLEWVVTPASTGKSASVLILPPAEDASAQLLTRSGEGLESGAVQMEVDPMGYSFRAEVPMTVFEVGPEEGEVHLDLRCLLGALGDAHSGGFCSLTGSGNRLMASLLAWRWSLREG